MNDDDEMFSTRRTDGATPIRADLHRAAVGIDVGDPSVMLTSVRQTVVKRRRRRNAVVGVAAAGTLVMSGVVIANVIGDDEPGVLTTSTESGSDDEAPIESNPEVAPPATPSPVAVEPRIGEQVTDPGFTVDASSYSGGAQLLEWNGGFLAVRSVYVPQPLPAEFPQEVIDQFPQEVIELFGGELPATIDEATEMLEEAGLLDEVSEIIASNPEVSEAIYSVSTTGTTTIRFSSDGIEWTDFEAAFPADVDPWSMVSTGDRVVAMSQPNVDPSGEGGEPAMIEVHSSTDLVNWTTQTIAAPERPADLPEYVDYQVYANSLAANSDRWVLSVDAYEYVEPLALIDPAIRDQIESSGSGYGIGADEEGLTITVGDDLGNDSGTGTYYEVTSAEPVDESGAVVPVSTLPPVSSTPAVEPATYTFTWAELGLDGLEQFERYQGGGEGSSTVWTSNGIDDPVAVSPGIDPVGRYGPIVALDSGFVAPVESGVSYSADGVTWTTVGYPDSGGAGSLMPVGDSVLSFVQASDGSSAGSTTPYRLDVATLTWSAVDIPGLPDGVWLNATGDGVATFMADVNAGAAIPEWTTTRMSVEVDGYRFESDIATTEGGESISYVVTELSSGRIVSTESVTGVGTDDPFEFAKEAESDRGGIVLYDPESGDELFVAEFDDILYEYLDADGEVVEVQDGEEFTDVPDEWILATDGVTWLVEQIAREGSPTDGDDAFVGVNDIALVDGIVLVSQSDGTFIRYELG